MDHRWQPTNPEPETVDGAQDDESPNAPLGPHAETARWPILSIDQRVAPPGAFAKPAPVWYHVLASVPMTRPGSLCGPSG